MDIKFRKLHDGQKKVKEGLAKLSVIRAGRRFR
jgi:hypothetical protein